MLTCVAIIALYDDNLLLFIFSSETISLVKRELCSLFYMKNTKEACLMLELENERSCQKQTLKLAQNTYKQSIFK